MHGVFHIAVVICLFGLNWAELHECNSKKNPHQICIKDEQNYKMSHPSDLSTLLFVEEIDSINEKEDSISIQATMVSYWEMDSTLGLSGNTDM